LQGDKPTAGIDVNFTTDGFGATPLNPLMPDRASLVLRCQPKEVDRDRNRRVLGVMFKEKLAQVFREIYGTDNFWFCCTALISALGNTGEYPDPQKVPASSWLSIAYKHAIFISHWPLDFKSPGPDFSLKELKNKELRIIVSPYLRRKLGIMYDDERAEEEGEELPEFNILPWPKGKPSNFLSLVLANLSL
jgi:hypothetical protein